MKKINFSNILIKGTEKFAKLAVLNLCWLLFSLPIVTIIPATDTLFTILNRSEEELKEVGSIFNQFTHFFKQNFRKSYKIGLPTFLIWLILGFDLLFLAGKTDLSDPLQIFKYGFYTFSLFLFLILLIIYPLSKKNYKYTYLQLVFAAMILLFNNPLITLGLLISILVLIIVFLFWPAMLFFFSVSGISWLITTAVSFMLKNKKTPFN